MFVDLCNELAKTTSVTALTYPNPALIERLDPSVQIITIPSASRYNLRNYWHIYQIVRNGGFDIINTHCAKATEIIYPNPAKPEPKGVGCNIVVRQVRLD